MLHPSEGHRHVTRREFSSAHDRLILMSENQRDGKERRSGDDRRESDRRNPERSPANGVLSTREGERRQLPRRKADRQPPKPSDD